MSEPAARERKLASILFADLVGSTELGSSLDPEHTRDLLDRFYEAMASEIALGGGTVEKFIGDAVVAVFGVPAAYEDHAERALSVALWMQLRLRELFGERLALRIGVNTGEVVVGRPREGSSFVTGDAVNVSARLEQAARPGQVLVGERTVAVVGGAFEFAEPVTVEAKGKEGGVACRELVRMIADRRSRTESSFVGREEELSRITDELNRTVEGGRAGLLTVIGEPGIGKTSLVREFRERLPPSTAFFLGRCLSYGRGVTYSPLADVLRAELGMRREDSPEAVLRRLGRREILGLTLGLDVGGALDPRAAGQRLRDEWVSFLAELTAKSAVVVVIEDLHWAAEPLVELLQLVLQEVDGPLLVLATTRPEGTGLLEGAASLTLRPLGVEDSGELAERVLGAPLEDAARELVLRQAEGNPFFLEEVLAGLLDRQLLRRRNGSWGLDPETRDLGVPDTVQALLAARIDQLPSSAKDTLGAAAVIGRSFSAAGLAGLVGTAADLRTLVERGFVRATEPELVFKHALTREVAYDSLPKATRARLHARYGSWLEQGDGGRPSGRTRLPLLGSGEPGDRRARVAWRGGRARAAQVDCAPLATARRRARRRALRSRRGAGAASARGRPRAGRVGALATDRTRKRAQVRRRSLLGRDAKGDRPYCGAERARRALRGACIRIDHARRHVGEAPRYCADRELVRPCARARGYRQPSRAQGLVTKALYTDESDRRRGDRDCRGASRRRAHVVRVLGTIGYSRS